ncbi:hypothetical protein, partial [Escherichia coli]|uniref:hypothetical protein n=1 Tax=Escherichia coli TaxID=562 RepID=UPI000E1D1F69
HMTFNSPDMKFTKNTFLKNKTDIFYIHQKVSPLPTDKMNKHSDHSDLKTIKKKTAQKRESHDIKFRASCLRWLSGYCMDNHKTIFSVSNKTY